MYIQKYPHNIDHLSYPVTVDKIQPVICPFIIGDVILSPLYIITPDHFNVDSLLQNTKYTPGHACICLEIAKCDCYRCISC